jgi:chemotaxis protein CheD
LIYCRLFISILEFWRGPDGRFLEGGGENPNFPSPIGNQNAELAEKLVKENRVEILTQDVSGQFGRKVIFNSGSGEILVYKINDVRREDWYGNHGIKN